ncbi:putative CRIB domain-containing protein RIC7 [Iris pallida]|uniref:CRIB domain-containing protein RIC7 n=1 Tax=Iris pallida TaxID=29817 RepID=A0AAX6FTT1_IRIPA|nr:putative CRIB domain-containing protein RIC7 [Iris pallida]
MSNKGNTKVKGLLKGLRYISNIFEGEKEQEMQIGFPTDVKHVAHIGWDGPAAVNNTPTWMNEFHSAPLTTSFGQDGRDVVCSPKSASQEIPLGGGMPSDSPPSKPPRRSRRHASASESPESGSATPEHESSSARASGSRHSRRQSGSEPSAEGSSRRGARRSSKSAGCEPGSESPARDLPSIPKQSRRRKTKTGSDGGGSSRPSARSKDPPPADADPETRPLPVLEAVAEGGI